MKRLISFTIMILMIFSFAACNPPKEENGEGLSLGFEKEDSGCLPSPSVYCAYTTEKSEIANGENLVISFYYGHIYSDDYGVSKTAEISLLYDIISSKYSINFLEATKIPIKTVENFGSEYYYWTDNPVCEEIVVPSKAFVGEIGYVGIEFQMISKLSEIYDYYEDEIVSYVMTIFYKKEDTVIRLSTTRFDC